MADHRLLDPAARLRQAREAKGLSHRQVAEATKLSVRAIESLESNCLADLPDGIYRRSIIRAVAREVGLNPEQLLNEFTTVHPDALPALAPAIVMESKPSSYRRLVPVLSAALPILAGVVYFTMPFQRPSTGESTTRTAAVQGVAPARAEVVPVGGFVDTSTPLPPARPVPVVVTLTISSRCQLRVVADGNEIIGRTMEQGETVPIELGEELLLLGDNASAVQFSINGQAGRLLGEPGEVLSARIGRDDYQDFLVRY